MSGGLLNVTRSASANARPLREASHAAGAFPRVRGVPRSAAPAAAPARAQDSNSVLRGVRTAASSPGAPSTSSPVPVAPPLSIGTLDADEAAEIQGLYDLNRTESKKLDAFVGSQNLSVVAISTGERTGTDSSITDTFDDYEDMQGVVLGNITAGDASMGSAPAKGTINLPGYAQGSGTASAGAPDMPRPGAEDTAEEADQVVMDQSVDMHAEEIDMYGDGSAVGSPVGSGAASVPPMPADVMPAAAGKGVGGAAAKLAASAGSAVGKIARSALAALSGIPPHTQWVALDNEEGKTRVVMLTAGSEVRASLSSAQPGSGAMVPFECSKNARVAPVVLLEARTLFMELLPAVSDAVERGAAVTLTGSGAGGSLASVVALMFAHQGLGANLRAVVFDAPAAVAEDSSDVLDGSNEQALVDAIMSGGLLSDMGLPTTTIQSVFTTPEPPSAAARVPARDDKVALMRPLGRLVAMPAPAPVEKA